MRKLRRMILLLLIGVVAVSSAAGGQSFTPLTDPAFLTPILTPMQRYELQGFSFLPPAGDDWFIISPSHPSHPVELFPTAAQALLIIKKLRESPPTRPEEDQTIYALVVTTTRFGELSFKPTEYLQNKAQELEEQYKADTRSGRFRPVEFKASIDNSLGANCLRYEKVLKDHRVRRFPGAVFIISNRAFLCPHPDFARFIVNLEYSQRYLQGEEPLPVEKEIEPFFKSLMFTPFRPLEAKEGEGAVSPEAARKELNRLYIPHTPGALLAHTQAGNSGAVRLLLTAGLDPNATVMGISPLFVAALTGYTDITLALLAKGAHVNAKDPRAGMTALMVAASTGHTDAVKSLLAAGADANASNKNDETALIMAANLGRITTVEALLVAGAHVNSRERSGRTALMWAAHKGRTAIVEALLAHGAEVNGKDNTGYTALMAAVIGGHPDTVEALLAKDADVNAKNDEGSTALMLAKEKGHILELLKKAGANE